MTKNKKAGIEGNLTGVHLVADECFVKGCKMPIKGFLNSPDKKFGLAWCRFHSAEIAEGLKRYPKDEGEYLNKIYKKYAQRKNRQTNRQIKSDKK